MHGMKLQRQYPVAPFTGAWIEILRKRVDYELPGSLPSRERGLKSSLSIDDRCAQGSLPSRERGLKFNIKVHTVAPRSRSLHGSVD